MTTTVTKRYGICEDWGHLFSDGKERSVRFVFDTAENELVRLQVQYGRRWELGTEEAYEDVEESLNDNMWPEGYEDEDDTVFVDTEAEWPKWAKEGA